MLTVIILANPANTGSSVKGAYRDGSALMCTTTVRGGVAPHPPVPPALGRWHARWRGFDLHAGIVALAERRDRLERLCATHCGRPSGRTASS
jgi:hypothetical protein